MADRAEGSAAASRVAAESRQGPRWCEEPCNEQRCPMLCGLPMGHDGDHACLPPDARTEHPYV